MEFLEKLKKRWKLKNIGHVVVVLIVFALTGFTVMFLKNPLLDLIKISSQNRTAASIIYYVMILPIYQVILLFYAFLFGQFAFFWEFEKRMMNRLLGIKKDHHS